jgi:hypothetical protein
LDVPSSLRELLDRARRREVSQLALDVGALAAGVLMAGAMVLLLAGTEILNWYWLVLLFGASVAMGAYRLRKTISSRYTLAQRIDRRMQLADELSTAYYFEENPRPDRASVCERQRQHAERVAGQVDVRQALPFQRSRFLAPAAILTIAALGLFAVRYWVVGSLDLGPSLVRIAYDNFFGNKTIEAENRAKRPRFDPITGQPYPDSPSLQSDLQPDETLDAGESQESNTDASDNAKEAAEGSKQSKEDGKQNGENDKQAGNDPNQQNGKDQDSKDSKEGNQNSSNKQDSKSGKESSLMDKLKDAVSDMMNKLTSQDKQEKSDKSQKGQPGDSKQKADKGQESQDKQSQNPSATDQQGQQGDNKESADASNDKKASDKSQAQDSKNGIGSQDGEKAIKEAAQLQAMGKITEILGKRSAQITGEVMVEVGSSKQQLKTPLSASDAKHAEAGSELHRDEIPLLYQPFVQQYFEEIRKGQTSPTASGAKKGPG